MKEVVCVNIGQGGVQTGNSIWEQLCVEHGITTDGCLKRQGVFDGVINNGYNTFFEEVPSGNFVPRAINADLEPSVIDEIKTGVYRKLWHPNNLINYKEDAANNFARGHYTIGSKILKDTLDQVRKVVSACDDIQGFLIVNSFGGGTGSGFTTLLLDKLAELYPNDSKFQVSIYPAPKISSAIVEPYNTVLTASKTINTTDVVMLLDNEGMYDVCASKLELSRPTYTNINRLTSQIFSSLTASIRFGSSLAHDMQQLQTNLIPYPRIHFPSVNYAPILDAQRALHSKTSASDITRELFEADNQLAKCDLTRGKFMSCCIQYRGMVTPGDVNAAINQIKSFKEIQFVDWCPTGFKIGICPMPPVVHASSRMVNTDRNAAMFCNNTAIVQLWKRIDGKFDKLYKLRAFIHWFVGEGMEEGEFDQAGEDIKVLEHEYEDVAKTD